MAEITITVTSPTESINVSVPSVTTPSVTVKDLLPVNASISPNVAYQNLTNLLDVKGVPSDNQMIVWDEDEGKFVFINLIAGGGEGGSGGIIASDLTVTNDDDAFSHLYGLTYNATDVVSLETILNNILDPTPASSITISNSVPTASGTYEVGHTPAAVYQLSFSVSSVSAFSGGLSIFINGSDSGLDRIVPTSTSNTAYDLQYNGSNYTYSLSDNGVYSDYTFSLSGTDGLSLNSSTSQSGNMSIKFRPRHLFYGSTTELTEGDSQSNIQSLYDSIVSATTSIASEQLVDRESEYSYFNDANKYNINTTDAYTYYFYEAYLGTLTSIKLGGPQGFDINDSFVHITNGGAVSISNGTVSTDYHVYRSRNKKAFTSGQTIYFKN